MKKLDACLSEVELNDYLSGALSRDKKSEVENHLRECGACLEKLVFAYEAVRDFNETYPQSSAPLRVRYSVDKSKGVKNMSRLKKNLWLFGAILAFALSFFVSRYFVQLLVAAILMAVKWIFDSVNARILIMIYDAWNRGGSDEASKLLRTFPNRLPR